MFSQKREIHRNRKKINDFLGTGRGLIPNGQELFPGGDGNALKLAIVMVAQVSTFTKNDES